MLRLQALGSVVVGSLIVFACTLEDPAPAGGTAGQSGSGSNEAGQTSEGGSANAGGQPSAAGTAGSNGATDPGGASSVTGGEGGGGAVNAGGVGADAGAGGEPALQPRTLPCAEQMRTDLPVIAKVSAGAITSQKSGDDFVVTVDATAGGLANAASNPWTYLKFTAQGLVKVAIDDEQSLTSLAWDIAAKRSGIRLNGGDGGPSYVRAAVLTGSAYADVTKLPSVASLVSESFYNAQCVLQETELGEPKWLLDPWFLYQGCVTTTGVPFIIELADGARLKLVVDAYYGAGQDVCDTTGSAGTAAANYTWRWRFL